MIRAEERYDGQNGTRNTEAEERGRGCARAAWRPGIDASQTRRCSQEWPAGRPAEVQPQVRLVTPLAGLSVAIVEIGKYPTGWVFPGFYENVRRRTRFRRNVTQNGLGLCDGSNLLRDHGST
jgi:hypothetical protein